MNKTPLAWSIPLVFAFSLGLAGMLGCPGNGTGTDGGGPTDAGNGGQDSGNGGQDSGNGGQDSGNGGQDSGTGMDAGNGNDAGTLSCDAYCTTIIANCTAGNTQYPTASAMQSCLGYCAGWMPGALGDMTGATLGCHLYHAGAAAGNPGLHCPHAGPEGGGVCGTACENFCAAEAVVCTGTNRQYPPGMCAADCATLDAGVGAYNDTFTAGNDLYCRIYHLTAAAASAGAANTHCAHTGNPATAFCL